ncbi:hypothetical protein AAH973_08945 [Enterococcus faecalis]|uniref:hypothetical protein n=1 Tax=Enterococcus faecalis TaxID=1351 RepID=UPI0031CD694D
MYNFKYDNFKSKGTSLIFKVNKENKDKMISLFELTEQEYEYVLSSNELKIYNVSNKLFLEKEFIVSDKLDFEQFLTRYSDKNLSEIQCFYMENAIFKPVSRKLEEERELYSKILDENNIVMDGISEDKIFLPPSLFSEIKMACGYEKDDLNSALNYLSELFSLFMIADKSRIKIDDDEVYFEFSIFCENNDNHILNVLWRDWSCFNTSVFYQCYEWILIKSSENFKEKTLLQVVKQYLGNLSSMENLEDITNSLDSILNRIIQNETHEYFLQQNKLKDEFIVYKKMDMESNNTLMKSLLGLITTIGLAYYGKVITMENFRFNEKNENLAIIFIFGLIAIVFFCISYLLNYVERKEYYKSLKDIYTKKFVFSEKDFEDTLKEPTIFKGHYKYWITLLCFFVTMIFAIFFYLGVI